MWPRRTTVEWNDGGPSMISTASYVTHHWKRLTILMEALQRFIEASEFGHNKVQVATCAVVNLLFLGSRNSVEILCLDLVVWLFLVFRILLL